jgi:hypothetical protein
MGFSLAAPVISAGLMKVFHPTINVAGELGKISYRSSVGKSPGLGSGRFNCASVAMFCIAKLSQRINRFSPCRSRAGMAVNIFG